MPFFCEVCENFSVEVLDRPGEFVATVPLGFDGDCRVSLLVALATEPGMPGDQYELVFSIIRLDGDDEEFFDGLATKPLIPDAEHRSHILAALVGATETLIDAASPRIVSMMTHTANLPDHALPKFHQLAALFRQKGYDAREADRYHGNRIWMMVRAV
jgi:hypothetical protein